MGWTDKVLSWFVEPKEEDSDSGDEFLDGSRTVEDVIAFSNKMQEHADMIGCSFYILSTEDKNCISQWYEDHGKKCDLINVQGYNHCFHNCGIGQSNWVECKCGEKLDLTDYGSW